MVRLQLLTVAARVGPAPDAISAAKLAMEEQARIALPVTVQIHRQGGHVPGHQVKKLN